MQVEDKVKQVKVGNCRQTDSVPYGEGGRSLKVLGCRQ